MHQLVIPIKPTKSPLIRYNRKYLCDSWGGTHTVMAFNIIGNPKQLLVEHECRYCCFIFYCVKPNVFLCFEILDDWASDNKMEIYQNQYQNRDIKDTAWVSDSYKTFLRGGLSLIIYINIRYKHNGVIH